MSELPIGWCEATIADVTGPFVTADPTKTPTKLKYVDIGSIDNKTQTVANPKVINGAEAPSRARRVIHTGDTLFSTVRTYLKNIALVPGDLDGQLTSTGIAVLRPNAAVDPQYLFTWACSDRFVEAISVTQDGTMYPAVSDSDVAGGMIRVPPLPEQRRIVAKIDSLSAKSRRARERLDHIPRLVAKYKQSILASAFRGELTRLWRLKNGVTDRTPITAEISIPYAEGFIAPSSWKQLRFSDICEIVGGSQPPKSTFKKSPAAGLVRLVQIRDYKSDDHITYIPKSMARRFCSKDDIMIGRYGPPIFQILRGIEGAYNVALMKAVPNQSVITAEFLFRYLNHPSLRSYVEFKSERTAGQDGVNKRHLLEWPVLLPPIEEQEELVRKIDTAFAWVERMASETIDARKLINHLDQAILSRAFRGELVPQDPNDEPASVLLERIRAERLANRRVLTERKTSKHARPKTRGRPR
jgi:type I restriction enzyme S subunit